LTERKRERENVTPRKAAISESLHENGSTRGKSEISRGVSGVTGRKDSTFRSAFNKKKRCLASREIRNETKYASEGDVKPKETEREGAISLRTIPIRRK